MRNPRLVVAGAIAVFGVVALHGQVNTATVTGSITDPSHAPITGAHASILNENTGFSKTADVSGDGQFTFDFLPIGTYAVTVEANGFNKLERKGVVLVAGQVLRLDLQLEVGSLKQTVTVTGDTPLIEHDTSNKLYTISNIEVRQLPQPKLDWSQLANIGPGTRLIPSAGAPSGNALISMNGLPGEGMSITLDGTNAAGTLDAPSIDFYTQPNVINTVNTDAIQEVSMNSGILPASVGGTMSGNVNIISKGGTNRFHGDLYEINSVAAYNARNQFLKNVPGFTFNQFGGSLGGPIWKDKLFFFGSYERVLTHGFQVINTTVPSPYLRSIAPATYSSLLAAIPVVPQPPGNPTALDSQYIGSGIQVNNDLNTTDRIDYIISPSNQINLRYVYDKPFKSNPNVIVSNPQVWNTNNSMFNMQFFHTGGTWTSSSRFGYNHVYYDRTQPGLYSDLEQVSLSGIFSAGGAEDSRQFGYYWTAIEDFSIVHGRQTIQFGGIVQRQLSNVLDFNTASFSYSTLSDFVNDTPSALQVTYDVPLVGESSYQDGVYVQDDIKVTSTFTLNLGLRYDLYTVPQEKDGLLFNRGIDPNRPSLGPGFGPYLPPSSIYNGDHNNFQPRIGFAWTLGASHKTVIRGGSGIFVSPTLPYTATRDELQAGPNLPFRLNFTRSQLLAADVVYPLTRSQFVPTLRTMQAEGIISSNLPAYETQPQDNPNPYSIQWMMGVERELGWNTSLTVNYVGNVGRHEIIWLEEDLPNRLTGIAVDPTFTPFILNDPVDSSRYNSLQISLNKRLNNGLTFQASYTRGSDEAYCNGNLAGRCYAQETNDISENWGPTAQDIRNNFNASVVYQLPIQRWTHLSGRTAQLFIGGWQLSGIFVAQDGLPFSVANPGSSYPADRADIVPNVDPYFSNYQSTLQYLNPAAFSIIPIVAASGASAHPGDSGRNAYFYPGMWNLDGSLSKFFAITEKLRLQLHGDFFNAFNHTNLTGINGSLTSSSFGKLTSATSRSVQIGARLEF